MALVFEGIQKVYPNGFRAVNHLDLEVKDGEFFTLLGPSGCGKTTTLRMIAGLETPSAGKVFIGGHDFTRTHPRDRDLAMVFQRYALYPHMTVREHLILNLNVLQVGTPQEIYGRPSSVFVAKFVGPPSINLGPVTARPAGSALALGLRGADWDLAGIALAAEDGVATRLAQLDGQAVLGVRPEAVTLSYEATAGAIPAVVELIEPMGSVNHVVLRFDGPGPVTVDDEPFVVVIRSNEPLEHGARVWAALLPDRLVLFDEQSGKAVATLAPRREWCCPQSSVHYESPSPPSNSGLPPA